MRVPRKSALRRHWLSEYLWRRATTGAGMYLLENPTRSYAWGSRTVIADLLGQPKSDNPQAELWIGAHPDSPSRLVDVGQDLRAHVARRPRDVLGSVVSETFGETLPYLLKVLAVERPLSLQTHPDGRQASQGHKAELVFAVSDFAALSGFRYASEARAAFDLLARRTPGVRAFGEIANLLESAADDADALRAACDFIARLDTHDVATMTECLPGAAANSTDPAIAIAAELATAYPNDRAVLLALLLRYVELSPGEALGVDPRTPHTYLRGTVIEVTTCSDNTIRAGLTSKEVDLAHFLDVVEYVPLAGTTLAPRQDSAVERTYSTGHDEFELSVVQVAPGESIGWKPKPRTILVLDGKLTLADAAGSTRLGRGDSVFVPADAGAVEVSGDGVAVQATTGV